MDSPLCKHSSKWKLKWKVTLDQKKKRVTLDHQTPLKHEIHFLSSIINIDDDVTKVIGVIYSVIKWITKSKTTTTP